MNNREICRFINSKDIRRHLLDINYSFSTIEAAWLVWQCINASLDEKIEAWKNIISTMPDQPVDRVHHSIHYKSVHNVLELYITCLETTLGKFLSHSDKAFFHYNCIYRNGGTAVFPTYYETYEDSRLYSSCDECLEEFKNSITKAEPFPGGVIRSEIDSPFCIEAGFCCDANGEVKISSVTDEAWLAGGLKLVTFFDDLRFAFPVPFEKGDILYNPYMHNRHRRDPNGPLVMTDIFPGKIERDGQKRADTTDMNIWGIFQDEIYGYPVSTVNDSYMDYEYYPQEKLKGKKRFLIALSNYVKGRIPLDLLLRGYHLTILDELADDRLARMYSEEELKLAGLNI